MMINTTINNYPLIKEIKQVSLDTPRISLEKKEHRQINTTGKVIIKVTEITQDFDYPDLMVYFNKTFSILTLKDENESTPLRCQFHLQAKKINYFFGNILLRDDSEIRIIVTPLVKEKTTLGWQKLNPETNNMLSTLLEQKLTTIFTNYIKTLADKNAHWLKETSPLDGRDFPCDDYGLIVVLNTHRFNFVEHWFKPENAGTWGGILTAYSSSRATFWDHFRATVHSKMTQHISLARNLSTTVSATNWDATLIM